MGLLEKLDGRGGPDGKSASEHVRSLVAEFHRENPLFHCVVLKHNGGPRVFSGAVADMTVCHGAVCADLSDKNCAVLLPGGLDMELFSHRISKSTGSAVVLQFSTDSPATAFNTLRPYLS